MITKEQIVDALNKGTAKIVPCPYGDGKHEPVFKIGDLWFYFAGQTGETELVEEYLKNVPFEDIIDEIYEVMNHVRDDIENRLGECKYFDDILSRKIQSSY